MDTTGEYFHVRKREGARGTLSNASWENFIGYDEEAFEQQDSKAEDAILNSSDAANQAGLGSITAILWLRPGEGVAVDTTRRTSRNPFEPR